MVSLEVGDRRRLAYKCAARSPTAWPALPQLYLCPGLALRRPRLLKTP